MLEAEATRLREILLGAGEISPLLNLGSSTRGFRVETQPHIERELFEPLRLAGIAVVHCDLKQAEGVDLSGNFLDPFFKRKLLKRGFRSILISNLLEHVRDRDSAAAACEEIVGAGGLILATVPSSFPYHADPIDTYYRPSPKELASLFRGSDIVAVEQVSAPSLSEEMAERRLGLWREVGRMAWSMLLLPIRPRSAVARVHRWLWFSRPRRVSIALMEVRRFSPCRPARPPRARDRA